MNPFFFVVALSLLAAAMHLFAIRKRLTAGKIVEVILLYQLVFTVGINSLLAFYGHAFMSDEIARYIGWPPGNPFQLEVAYTNLTFGILGLLCIWLRGNFWVATVLGISIWYLADAYGHLKQLILYHNDAPGNAGVPLYADIFIPLALLSLLTAHLLLNSRKSQG